MFSVIFIILFYVYRTDLYHNFSINALFRIKFKNRIKFLIDKTVYLNLQLKFLFLLLINIKSEKREIYLENYEFK